MRRARVDLPVRVLHARHLWSPRRAGRLRDAKITACNKMDLQIKGTTALVCGASKGIGRGIAEALAAEGVAVAIVARTQATIDATASEMTARGAKAIGFAADLANWSATEVAVKSAREQLGPIDILVNNSGG